MRWIKEVWYWIKWGSGLAVAMLVISLVAGFTFGWMVRAARAAFVASGA